MAVAFLLAPMIGYMGIILAEPIVWFVMVMPLVVNMARNPVPADGGCGYAGAGGREQ